MVILVGDKCCSSSESTSIDFSCGHVSCAFAIVMIASIVEPQAQTCDPNVLSTDYKYVAVRLEEFLSSRFLAQAAQHLFLFQGTGW